MRVHVTADDIAYGERFNCHRCPVALAIRGALLVAYVAVGPVLILTRRRWTPTPLAVAAFIRAFDAGEAVEPFAIELPQLLEWSERV